jgi:hypothetical protein
MATYGTGWQTMVMYGMLGIGIKLDRFGGLTSELSATWNAVEGKICEYVLGRL